MSDLLKRCKPPYAQQNITHYKQRFNWDCGLACILMLLTEQDKDYFLNNFDLICKNEGIDKSTWTIDLCYILKKFNIVHIYYTKTFGVHSGYKGQAYYDRILQKDEHRINEKFECASSYGLSVTCESLDNEVLKQHLELYGPIIVLVDSNLLICDACKMNKLNIELRSCLPWPTQYMGHYIVLCAFDDFKQKFIYRNPTFKDRLCVISYSGLETARKSFGTDEDIILIFNR